MNAQEVWLTPEEVGTLLGLSKRHINRNLAAGKYLSRQVKAEIGGGKGGLKNEILLQSLPESAQKKYEKTQIDAEKSTVSGQEGELAGKRVLLKVCWSRSA